MDSFDQLREKYKSVNVGNEAALFGKLKNKYMIRSNYRLLDSLTAASASGYLSSLSEDQRFRFTENIEEAFNLAYPTSDIADLTALRGEELQGFINGTKGKYFELLIADSLNKGKQFAGLHLSDGQTAVLADNPVNPGWDIKILNSNGTIDKYLQAKATDSAVYVNEAIEKYPDIDVVSTEEVGKSVGSLDGIHVSDISNEDLNSLFEDSFSDSSQHLIDGRHLIPLLPFFIILLSEIRSVQRKKRTVNEAIKSVSIRSVKSAVAVGVGYLFSLVKLNVFAFPASFLVRLSIDRHLNLKKMDNVVAANQANLKKEYKHFIGRGNKCL